MRDRSEFSGAGADGVGPGEELAGRPGRRRRLRRLVLLAAAGLVSADLVAACSPLHPSAPDRSAQPTGPRADSPAPSTAALSTVDSPVADPAPLPDRPLARAAFLYSRCNPMNVEDENCRFRLVLTDGSQYTLGKSVMHEGPGPIFPDGAFLLLYDGSEGLILRHLESGTSRAVALPDHLAAWGPVFWSPGARWAAVSADGPDGQKAVVVDITGASVRRVEDPAPGSAHQHRTRTPPQQWMRTRPQRPRPVRGRRPGDRAAADRSHPSRRHGRARPLDRRPRQRLPLSPRRGPFAHLLTRRWTTARPLGSTVAAALNAVGLDGPHGVDH